MRNVLLLLLTGRCISDCAETSTLGKNGVKCKAYSDSTFELHFAKKGAKLLALCGVNLSGTGWIGLGSGTGHAKFPKLINNFRQQSAVVASGSLNDPNEKSMYFMNPDKTIGAQRANLVKKETIFMEVQDGKRITCFDLPEVVGTFAEPCIMYATHSSKAGHNTVGHEARGVLKLNTDTGQVTQGCEVPGVTDVDDSNPKPGGEGGDSSTGGGGLGTGAIAGIAIAVLVVVAIICYCVHRQLTKSGDPPASPPHQKPPNPARPATRPRPRRH